MPTHRGLYVGATRGRRANHLLVITEEPDLADARDLLSYVLTHDRVDVPATAQRRHLAETVRGAQPSLSERRAAADRRVQEARSRAAPFEAAVEGTRRDLETAESRLTELREQRCTARAWARGRYDEPITEAEESLDRARQQHDDANEAAGPTRASLGRPSTTSLVSIR